MSPLRRGSLTLGAGIVVALVAAAAAVWWTRPPFNLITTGQILALLPARSTLHSLVQVDLDAVGPSEAAAIVMIPAFPGASASGYAEIIARYDRWRRRHEIVYQRLLSGMVPVSVDAGRLLDTREGVLFQGVTDNGLWSFRVVGQVQGRVAVLAEGESSERITLDDPWVIDRSAGRALRWDGTRLAAGPMPAAAGPPASTVVWRYALRNGRVSARIDHVLLQPRQVLRLQRSGGGTTPIIVPDARLDVVENGFRARRPGTYAIRLLIPFTTDAEAFVLTLRVADTPP